MAANDTNMGWNCNSNGDKHKYNGKILTGTWLPPHYRVHETRCFEIRVTGDSTEYYN